jgi:hypothetical protein
VASGCGGHGSPSRLGGCPSLVLFVLVGSSFPFSLVSFNFACYFNDVLIYSTHTRAVLRCAVTAWPCAPFYCTMLHTYCFYSFSLALSIFHAGTHTHSRCRNAFTNTYTKMRMDKRQRAVDRLCV